MRTISLRLPESLHDRVRLLAKKDRISINQFVSSAVAEKISALETEEYILNRAKRASRAKFRKALAAIPKGKPIPGDEI